MTSQPSTGATAVGKALPAPAGSALPRLRLAFTLPGSPWPWIAVAALAILPHLRALALPFIYDDWAIIANNPYMIDPHPMGKIFRTNVWGFAGQVAVSNYYRPLMHLYHYGIYQWFGARPGAFHLFCLLLHAAASLLVMRVVRRVSGNQATGVVAGLLFAVLPVHTEVTAWIACSPELLCGVFSLLAFVFYLRASEAAGPGRALLASGTAVLLLLAQLSKEVAVMLPAVIAAHELLVRRRGPLEQLKKCWPEYLALAAATLAYLAMRANALARLFPAREAAPLPVGEQLYTAVALFYRYLAVMLWPARLSFFRYYRTSSSPVEPAVLAGGLSLAAFLVLGVWLYRRRLPEVLALPLYLCLLLPVFVLPYLSEFGWLTRGPRGLLLIERAAYLPSIGFCWLAAAGLVKLRAKWSAISVGLAATIILGGYTARSAARLADWHDEVELFEEGFANSPDPSYLYVFRAEVLLRHNRPGEALVWLLQALPDHQDDADLQNLLGRAYLLRARPGPAVEHYRRAAELALKDGHRNAAARAWTNIGIVYRSLGRDQEAAAAYREALGQDPKFAPARSNLAYILLLEGQPREAVRELGAALAIEPGLWQAHANLGLAHAMLGRWDAAWLELNQAERLSPDNGEVQARMGEVLLARGELDAARSRFRRALQLEPQNSRALAGISALRSR
jgi:Flp pilus assembly protein TadD/uncharacterized membrane protein